MFIKEEKMSLPSHRNFGIEELLAPYTKETRIPSEHNCLDLDFYLQHKSGEAIKEENNEKKSFTKPFVTILLRVILLSFAAQVLKLKYYPNLQPSCKLP